MIRTMEARYRALQRLDAIESRALRGIDWLEEQIDRLIDQPGASEQLAELRRQRGRLWRRAQFVQASMVITKRGAH